MYDYYATILSVIDGDTVHAQVEVGFDITARLTLRLDGINAPEMGTPEGPPAKAHLVQLLATGMDGLGGRRLLMRSHKDHREKYGRYLATLYPGGFAAPSANQRMIDDGFAVAYDGGRRAGRFDVYEHLLAQHQESAGIVQGTHRLGPDALVALDRLHAEMHGRGPSLHDH
ncbi:MAG: thermonuclease family protein [Actinobacteria bacterium]|nr:thermonuclease family protein [Actinomycetota bacterium]